MWPVFAERVRRAEGLAYDAASKTATKIIWVLHGLENSEFQTFSRIVYLEDVHENASRIGPDQTPMAGVIDALAKLDEEITRLRSIVATPVVIEAVNRHNQWMGEVHGDFIKRGKVDVLKLNTDGDSAVLSNNDLKLIVG